MALPVYYSLRNVVVRRASAILTALGIGITVAVFTGVLSLHHGFMSVFSDRGSETIGIYLRPGATSEGESGLTRETVNILVKERPEILIHPNGQPLAAAEMFLAVYMEKIGGGLTNVPLRGIQPMSLEIYEEGLKLVEGRWLGFGTDELVVGRPLTERMQNCKLGDTLKLNLVPFKVVGVFEHDGAYGGEVWGDVERMMRALERPVFQRVVARVKADVDAEALDTALRSDERTPVQFSSERKYLQDQTQAFGGMLEALAYFLVVIMGLAAVLGAMNTMIASVTARTHEIGVLLAIGYPRSSIFWAFVIESALVGVIGGALGVLFVLPFNGYETGAMNWNTFTDVSFAYRLNPTLVAQSFALAFVLGLLGGSIPALRAAMLSPVEALRHH